MSIYSGFATRSLEQTYDDCVDSILYILQKRILKFYKNQYTDEDKFIDMLGKLYSQIRMMESHKYLEPKNSHTVEELVHFLKKKQMKEASNKSNFQATEQNSIHSSEVKNKFHPAVQILNQRKKRNSNSHDNSEEKQKDQAPSKEKIQLEQNQNRLEMKKGQSKKKDFNIKRPETNFTKMRQRKSHHIVSMNKELKNHGQTIHITDSKNVLINHRQSRNKIRSKSNTKNHIKSLKEEAKNFSKHKFKEENNHLEGYIFDGDDFPQHNTFTEENDDENEQNMQNQQQILKEETPQRESHEQSKNNQIYQSKNVRQKSTDVRDLIKSYINKTKKNYNKSFNKRAQEIENIFNDMKE